MDFSLSTQQTHWQNVAREFAEREVQPIARAMDEERSMPLSLVHRMASLGLLGTTLPRVYGGSEMDRVSLALVYAELGRACSSVRGFMTVHSSLVMQCIHRWGNEAQKTSLLPPLASAEQIGCYALTEPEAGSDAASIQTSAVRTADGYVLNGEKFWITNGTIADIAIVFARLDELEATKPHQKITAFLVPLQSAGVARERMPGKELGHSASDHAHITFSNVFVPSGMRLGAEGDGFKVAMSALDGGRLGVASGALGVHQACLDASVAFVRNRRQFGQRIADFEMVQSCIAEMKASLEASRNLVLRAAWVADAGDDATLDTSIAKYFATEAACKAASDAVLLHGGRGYSNEYPVERYYRDIKGMQIYEGTAFVQKIVIARKTIGRE